MVNYKLTRGLAFYSPIYIFISKREYFQYAPHYIKQRNVRYFSSGINLGCYNITLAIHLISEKFDEDNFDAP
jgi:hypothetical protein